jgi:hypothetical protein
MTGTVPDMVRALVLRTKLNRTHVEQRARSLQDAGLIQRAIGTARPAARASDLARLLLGLGADRVRQTAGLVQTYSNLERIGDHHTPRLAGEAIEQLIARIWLGNRTSTRTAFHIVQSPAPEIIITLPADKAFTGDHFYERGAVMEYHALDQVRRVLEIPGCIIAQVGADLGFARCQDAI